MRQWRAEEIAYCANVHPGVSADALEKNILEITQSVRKSAGLDRMYSGLWVCESALIQYQDSAKRQRLKSTLAQAGILVQTLNGFPLNDFHQPVVKLKVYSPDWSDPRRLEYSKGLAELLADILPPEDRFGTVSTLPLGYRNYFDVSEKKKACENLCLYALHAHEIYLKTAKQIRLCLEMEPGCVLEKTEQIVHFFHRELHDCCSKMNIDTALVYRYLGVCYDICHQAVMQEDIKSSLAVLTKSNISIGKVQVSSALRVAFDERKSQLAPLKYFAEPKYMHQLTANRAAGEMPFLDDLVDAFNNEEFLQADNWNIHFHLPIHAEKLTCSGQELCGFSTTQGAIQSFLDYLCESEITPHIEIETYTWEVLPDFFQRSLDQNSLVKGLSREHAWLVCQMKKRDLLLTNTH